MPLKEITNDVNSFVGKNTLRVELDADVRTVTVSDGHHDAGIVFGMGSLNKRFWKVCSLD